MKARTEPDSVSGGQPGDPPRGAYRRVLLVGFMGSGKTTVGRTLARLLGWEFLDFDDVVQERAGRSIPEIFREEGEARFREMEARVGRDLLVRSQVVLASGGGWPTGSGRIDGLADDTLSVWLRVSPEEAVRRVEEKGPVRPLLEAADPLDRARELLARRREHYRKARLTLDSESRPPEELAREIARVVRVPHDS